MKQIVLQEPGSFTLRDVEAPSAPKEGEVLVKVRRVGICGTDLHAFQGQQNFFSYPRVLGHELGVEVIEAGAGVTGFEAGDLCCVEPYMYSGTCVAGRAGKGNCAVDMQVLGVHVDGGMCEYINLPANKLIKSTKMSVDQLALVEMLGIGAHAVRRAEVRDGEWVLVIGAGPIGLGTMQFAKAAGANVIAMDINDQRLEFCKGQLGIEHTVNAKDNPLEKIAAITSDELATAVFDATGFKGSMEAAFSYAGHGGRVVFVGHTKGDIGFQNPEFHKRELSLLASRNATNEDLRHVVSCIEEGRVDTNPWITHRATFDSLIEKFPSWLKPETGVVKAMLDIS